jgi:hypothetical protein
MKCSNCELDAGLTTALILYQGTKTEPVAVICEKCQESVTTLKIVVARRTAKIPFSYEGYLPVSTER